MSTPDPEFHLREAIGAGLESLAEMGVSMAAIARVAGVDRSTLGRWRAREQTPRPQHRERLAAAWPAVFDPTVLAPAWARYFFTGATAGHVTREQGTTAEVYATAVDELLAEPVPPAERLIRHALLHVDVPGGDAAVHDPYFTGRERELNLQFRDTLARRAGDDHWEVRSVISTGDVDRVDGIARAVAALPGPRVSARAYALGVPPVILPLIIGSRVAFLGLDDVRTGKPGATISTTDPTIVGWATRYFDVLYDHAPYRLRTWRGVSEEEFDRFRADVVARDRRTFG